MYPCIWHEQESTCTGIIILDKFSKINVHDMFWMLYSWMQFILKNEMKNQPNSSNQPINKYWVNYSKIYEYDNSNKTLSLKINVVSSRVLHTKT